MEVIMMIVKIICSLVIIAIGVEAIFDSIIEDPVFDNRNIDGFNLLIGVISIIIASIILINI